MTIQDVSIEGSTVAVQVFAQEIPIVAVEVSGQETPFGGVQVITNDETIQVGFSGEGSDSGSGGGAPVPPPTGNLVTSVFGRLGDVLAMPGDYAEFFAPLGTELPPSGLSGQILAKLSDASYDAGWIDAPETGGSIYSDLWSWTNKTGDADNSGQVGASASSWAAVTVININETTKGGRDMLLAFQSLFTAGNEIVLQQKNDSSNYARYLISAAPVDHGVWWSFPVTHVSSGGVTPTSSDTTVSLLVKGSGGGGTPGGSTTQVQFNDAGVFGGDAGLTYAKATDTLTSGNVVVAGTITGNGTVPTGGATGQVLKKTTSTNYDVAWAPDIGGGAGGDLSYVHTQVAPASNWSVAHNLGKFPAVDVIDSGSSVIIADVHYVDSNNLTVLFGSATSGKAYLN